MTKRTEGITFLIDAADRTRFQEAKGEDCGLLDDPALASTPFVVLGKNIDIAVAADEDVLRHALGFPSHMTSGCDTKCSSGVRPVEIFMRSIVKRMGHAEGSQWISQFCT